VDTINHVLNELPLGSAESPSVGDIEHTVVGLSVLSMDTTDLDEVFISNSIELLLLGHKFG
jgi:hypothetical protein